ncbi:hypothetical protein [Actinacidiphila yeochonensis]|uniref:hypothetical protein n=1 Tax=Actinacidiphila yeochonensis TaxID=89050 RepID=UPI00056C5826|nr:hypothetical protein [Actinacidiphila yeochonensis]
MTEDTTTFFKALDFVAPDILTKHSRADVVLAAQETCGNWRANKHKLDGHPVPDQLWGFSLMDSISITTVAVRYICSDQSRAYLTWLQQGQPKQ